MASSHMDTTGFRENLTPVQTRALYRLWHRFFRLCEMPAGSLSGTSTNGHPSNLDNKTVNPNQNGKKNSASSSGQNIAGGSIIPDSNEKQTQLKNSSNTVGSTSSIKASSSSAGASYGKPLQRQVSNVRQIDERGGHIPKDDRVKDELKTLEEAKEMREFLERYGGERLRQVFWEIVKGEHPDAVMLRFLRARKWNVDRAIAVIGSTAAFRADNDVATILRGGELALTSTRGGMNMLANGISYIYGATSIGEPVYFIEVGNHFSHNQTQQELKQGVIFLQEIIQLSMPPPIERKVVIFNMNDFGIRNMDWWCVFFMVKTMESYYVETLSRVYVHGAPWIFKPIWAILKPLLDPVVRDKVRLTFSAEELAEHVPFNHLPKGSMRGGMDWKFEFPLPDPHENDLQKDTETRDRLHKEYMEVASAFEAATKEISTAYARASFLRRGGNSAKRGGDIQDVSLSSDEEDNFVDEDPFTASQGRRPSDGTVLTGDGRTAASVPADDIGASLKARRDVLATKLRVAFLKLRPYIVGKSMMDRWGVLKDDGKIVWKYRSVDGEEEEQVLGEGTTLPELERNLEMIEQASAQPKIADNDDDKSSPSSQLASSQTKLGNKTTSGDSPNSAGVNANSHEMNRRQQRLKNRSRPGSGAMEISEIGNGQAEGDEERNNDEIINSVKSKLALHEDADKTSDSAASPVPVHPLHQSSVPQEQ